MRFKDMVQNHKKFLALRKTLTTDTPTLEIIAATEQALEDPQVTQAMGKFKTYFERFASLTHTVNSLQELTVLMDMVMQNNPERYKKIVSETADAIKNKVKQ